METLITNMKTLYYNEKHNYSDNAIQLYYIQNNITVLKTQYKLLTADKHLLFTLLYRQLCQCYKQKQNINRLWWYKHKRTNFICNIIDAECLYVLNTYNITLLPMTYYDIIWDMCYF